MRASACTAASRATGDGDRLGVALRDTSSDDDVVKAVRKNEGMRVQHSERPCYEFNLNLNKKLAVQGQVALASGFGPASS